eukprot:CAMPEP_0118992472 /NCGR_PEP_ID=MMETSP1173-20130426/53466_1 /TAXON_ID=1034831 /ORGANISM="Rhizochromulina marina cf, Strain CCMP1243" /LENGTH=42 /DNA_ID= /DNA_START= /DNA_END= /DNA_ORIENTATION=
MKSMVFAGGGVGRAPASSPRRRGPRLGGAAEAGTEVGGDGAA